MQDVGCRCTLNGVTFTYYYKTYNARVLLTELPLLSTRFHLLRLFLTLRALHHEYSSNTRMEAALKFCLWCSNDKKGQGCHSCTTTPRLCSSTTI